MPAKSLQSCPTLCDPMDCSPGSSVHGILQAKILEWVALPYSRGSSWPRDQTWVSHFAGRFFTTRATWGQGPPKCHLFIFINISRNAKDSNSLMYITKCERDFLLLTTWRNFTMYLLHWFTIEIVLEYYVY